MDNTITNQSYSNHENLTKEFINSAPGGVRYDLMALYEVYIQNYLTTDTDEEIIQAGNYLVKSFCEVWNLTYTDNETSYTLYSKKYPLAPNSTIYKTDEPIMNLFYLEMTQSDTDRLHQLCCQSNFDLYKHCINNLD